MYKFYILSLECASFQILLPKTRRSLRTRHGRISATPFNELTGLSWCLPEMNPLRLPHTIDCESFKIPSLMLKIHNPENMRSFIYS